MPILLANTAIAIFMFLIGCTLLVSILMRRSYQFFDKSKKSRVITGLERLPRPQNTWDGAYQDLTATTDRQEVEMSEVARNLMGQLSAKTIVLEQLIGDSQRQIERMEKLLERLEQTPKKR